MEDKDRLLLEALILKFGEKLGQETFDKILAIREHK
jgi:hypothetical protein